MVTPTASSEQAVTNRNKFAMNFRGYSRRSNRLLTLRILLASTKPPFDPLTRRLHDLGFGVTFALIFDFLQYSVRYVAVR
jgi:hypothetical protein